jgi:hypothetical protein
MGDDEALRDFPDQAQRFAFCNSQWERHLSKESDAPGPHDFTEQYDRGFPFAESTVDRDAGLISNVSFLGRLSKNNRIYSSAAMSGAAKLHKGAGVYLDHPTREEERSREGVRSVRDLAGHALNAHVHGDRVRGDIRALKGTPTGEFLLAVAEQAPKAVGISHRATGTSTINDDGSEVVESVTAVGGLDLVTEPATVSGLFEQIHFDNTDTSTTTTPKKETTTMAEPQTLSVRVLKEDHADLVEELRAELLSEHKETEELAELKAENQRLRGIVEQRDAEDAARDRIALVDEKLKAAKLPERLVTEDLRQQLLTADDESEIDSLLAYSIRVYQEAQREVRKQRPATSFERDPDVDLKETTPGAIDGDALANAYATMWG